MALKEKITEKEQSIRTLLETLRAELNAKRIIYNQNPNDWTYITSLSFTENKLKEVIEFIETSK